MLKKMWQDTVGSNFIANAAWDIFKLIIFSITGLSVFSSIAGWWSSIFQWITVEMPVSTPKWLFTEIPTPKWLFFVAFAIVSWKFVDNIKDIRSLFKERFRGRFKERDEARNESENIKHLLANIPSQTDSPARKFHTIKQPRYGSQAGYESILTSEPVSNTGPAEIPKVHLTTDTADYIDNRIVRFLYDGEPQSASAITTHLGMDSYDARYALRRLVNNGVVRQQSSKDLSTENLYTLDKDRLLEVTKKIERPYLF